MIVVWRDPIPVGARHGSRFRVFDAETGVDLSDECIFYADDEAALYRRNLGGHEGHYCWDSRTKKRPVGRIPGEFLEVAWEEVRRPIVLVENREGGYVTPKRIKFREFT